MADENTPNEDDVEAEMMRMMQEETGDEGGEGEEDIMAAMAAAMSEDEGDDVGDGNIDEMLEAEMLKAMQTDTGDAADGGGGWRRVPVVPWPWEAQARCLSISPKALSACLMSMFLSLSKSAVLKFPSKTSWNGPLNAFP